MRRRPPACRCRKPALGLLHEAAALHGIDLARSWMVGDTLDDVEAGRRAGCNAVLVETGGGGGGGGGRPNGSRDTVARSRTTLRRPRRARA
ncbi:MAG: HAD hydrolase-like protein [Rubrivivax sp.]